MKRDKSISFCAAMVLLLSIFVTGCGPAIEADPETTEQVETTYSTDTESESETTDEMVEETETTAEAPEYQMAYVATSSVTSDSQYSKSAYIRDSDTDYTGVTFYAMTFVVQLDQRFTINVYDAETGEDLSDSDESHLYSYAGYVLYEEAEEANPLPITSWDVTVGEDSSHIVTYVLESLTEYVMDDIIVTTYADDGEVEIVCNAELTDFNTTPAYPIDQNLLNIDGNYFVLDTTSGGAGGNTTNLEYSIVSLICVSDFYADAATGLTTDDVVFLDPETGEEIELPGGLSYYFDEEADGREVALHVGLQASDEYKGNFDTLDGIVKDSLYQLTLQDGSTLVLE